MSCYGCHYSRQHWCAVPQWAPAERTLSLIWLKNDLLPPDWDEQHALFDGFDT
jgi:hypothetical protein